jgi:hypothetical protein
VLKYHNKGDLLNQTRYDYADYYYRSADNDDFNVYTKIHYYEKALRLYHELKNDNKYNEVYHKIENLRSKLSDSFQTFTTSIDISEQVNIIRNELAGKNAVQSILSLGDLTPLIKRIDIEERIKKEMTEFSFSSLFPQMFLDNDGHTTKKLKSLDRENPKKDEDNYNDHLYHSITFDLGFFGNLIKISLDIVKKEHNIELTDLDFLINDNALIPNDRQETVKFALYLGLNEHPLEFLSIICPQIENIFREISDMCGGIVTKYNREYTEQEYINLTAVLDNKELNECFDEDALFVLKSLLNAKSGINIRNMISHGLCNSKEADNNYTYFLLGFLIKLFSWFIPYHNYVEQNNIHEENT